MPATPAQEFVEHKSKPDAGAISSAQPASVSAPSGNEGESDIARMLPDIERLALEGNGEAIAALNTLRIIYANIEAQKQNAAIAAAASTTAVASAAESERTAAAAMAETKNVPGATPVTIAAAASHDDAALSVSTIAQPEANTPDTPGKPKLSEVMERLHLNERPGPSPKR